MAAGHIVNGKGACFAAAPFLPGYAAALGLQGLWGAAVGLAPNIHGSLQAALLQAIAHRASGKGHGVIGAAMGVQNVCAATAASGVRLPEITGLRGVAQETSGKFAGGVMNHGAAD